MYRSGSSRLTIAASVAAMLVGSACISSERPVSASADGGLHDGVNDTHLGADALVDTSMDTSADTRADTSADTRADTSADTRADTTADTRADTTADTDADTETSDDTTSDSGIFSPADTSTTTPECFADPDCDGLAAEVCARWRCIDGLCQQESIGVHTPLNGEWRYVLTRFNEGSGAWFSARGVMTVTAGAWSDSAGSYDASSADQPYVTGGSVCSDGLGQLQVSRRLESAGSEAPALYGQVSGAGDLIVAHSVERAEILVAVKRLAQIGEGAAGGRYRAIGFDSASGMLRAYRGWLALDGGNRVAADSYIETSAEERIDFAPHQSSTLTVGAFGDANLVLDLHGEGSANTPDYRLRGQADASADLIVLSPEVSSDLPRVGMMLLLRESEAAGFSHAGDYTTVGLAAAAQPIATWGRMTIRGADIERLERRDSKGDALELMGCPANCPGWWLTRPGGSDDGGGAYYQQVAEPAGAAFRAGQVGHVPGTPPSARTQLIVTYPVVAGGVLSPPSAAWLELALRRVAPTAP